jgi:hypothetical protein
MAESKEPDDKYDLLIKKVEERDEDAIKTFCQDCADDIYSSRDIDEEDLELLIELAHEYYRQALLSLGVVFSFRADLFKTFMEKYNALQEENLELKLRPPADGGELYQKTKEHYDSL